MNIINTFKNFFKKEKNESDFRKAYSERPLLFAPKTYNTCHPLYDATVVRNFPGKIFNADESPCNPLYDAFKKICHHQEIPSTIWDDILKSTLAEIKAHPEAKSVFERIAFTENYIKKLEKKYHAFYRPGWVNLEDAIFLYWVVRQLKPQTIVQSGVCNGLSSAFMMLALVNNGPLGNLHVVDLPQIFDPKNPAWTVKNETYGVIIPEGKTSGWLVPDVYQDRFHVITGDAKLLLPDLLKKLGHVDMFFHDSDHTYDHMMFEFKEVKNYLKASGVIVADDISWNASLWDFADSYRAPAYNYRGTMGVACF